MIQLKTEVLSAKDYVELRLKCLEPYIQVASKAGIEQDTVIRKAAIAWEFAVKGLDTKVDKK